MDEAQRFEALRRKLLPPAVVPLIEAYTSHKRKWNGNHRDKALDQLHASAHSTNSLWEFHQWVMNHRYAGPLVELWFAFRCYRAEAEPLPDDEIAMLRRILRRHYAASFREPPPTPTHPGEP